MKRSVDIRTEQPRYLDANGKEIIVGSKVRLSELGRTGGTHTPHGLTINQADINKRGTVVKFSSKPTSTWTVIVHFDSSPLESHEEIEMKPEWLIVES